MRPLVSAALLLASACTISSPFGVECVSDQNCGCASCCIAYRCTAYGSLALDAGSGVDGGGSSDAGALTWTVSTFAGGQRGALDGQGVNAQLNSPSGLAFDSTGALFVADSANNCIRRIDADGNVSTFAAAAIPCGGTALDDPNGLAFDEADNLYVANTGRNCIMRVTPAGQVSVAAGQCSQQSNECLNSPNPVRLSRPLGLAWADPFLYATETSANHVRWVNVRGGTGGVLAGQGFGSAVLADGTCGYDSGCTGSPSGATFSGPAGLAVASPGVLWVTDVYNCALRRVSVTPGCAVATVGRSGCPMFVSENTQGILRNAFGVVAGRGPLAGFAVAADTGNHRIALMSETGVLTPLAGTTKGFLDGAAGQAQFNTPYGIAIDSRGRVFVADTLNHRIRLVSWEVR
ncbi:MAG: SMP-30/gluconolactonase/LRE family protein [Myxococcaceae bacterium]|nr:SMP-30/gluconolactonase/LRE family protein [Myxococcaceae bacterium]